MKLVVQRVLNATVTIDNKSKEKINGGLVVFLGIHKNDNINNVNYLIKKLINLRIFEKCDKMNLSLKDIEGDILLISQFTLYANTKNGNRPSFEDSMKYKEAEELYNIFVNTLKEKYNKVKTGKFGSDMKVELVNDGPVTILLEDKNE